VLDPPHSGKCPRQHIPGGHFFLFELPAPGQSPQTH
jgi:hypothetical protein